jgi:hypothetical protein
MFVGLHHPPVDLHVDRMDPIKLTTAEGLAEVLARHGNVVAVLVGHAHTMAITTFAGVPVLVGGGLVSTITTDAEDLPRIDYARPPSIALHLIVDDHLVTHWRVVSPFTSRVSPALCPGRGPSANHPAVAMSLGTSTVRSAARPSRCNGVSTPAAGIRNRTGSATSG